MLDRLVIRDLALVERAEVTFGPGLVAVTGETGAGKSLLVSAVSLLVGGRADASVVREGARAAVVEGEFRLAGDSIPRVAELLAEWGIDPDIEALIVRREVTGEGRSRASVNQSPVTVASLKRLGELLLDLHGQHEHQSLLKEGAPLATLDRLGGLEAERAHYAEALAASREAHGELARLEQSLATYAERRDYLMGASAELSEARLEDGEEETLAASAARLAHADRLRLFAAQALEQLADGDPNASTLLAAATHALEQAQALDPSLGEVVTPLREAAISVAEATRALTGYSGKLEADPESLEVVESRRDMYARLKRKYRRDVPGLIAWRAELDAELAQGEDAEGALARARAKGEQADAECRRAAQELSQRRRAAAKEWSDKLTRELKPLGFPHARIAFEVSADPDPEPTATGIDEVSLAFTANPGEGPRPLARIASGGELSRVMLALKCALQTRDRVDVLLFDEVDSGIGGAVAQAVGERLRRLSEHRQVICVTHLPMIAALASHHLGVSKRVSGGRTVARIETLEPLDRIEELARMLAGDRVTETTRHQARELLQAGPGSRAR